MATPTPPKSMSSRLLTMKFMQRAAASPLSSPATPNSDEQASKRRKVSHDSTKRELRDSLPQIDQSAIQAAIAEEERKRQEALIQHAAELGDARWVLDVPDQATGSGREVQTPLNVVQVGFAQIDSHIDSSDAAGLDDTESTDTSHPRTPMVRRYNMDRRQVTKDSESGSDDSNSDSDSDASAQENKPGRHSHGQRSESRSGSSRPALKSKKSAEWAKAKQLAESRRKKEVKLNSPRTPTGGGLLSISSGGGSSLRQPTNFTCHRCGKPGHKAAECKNSSKRTTR
ncbi:hypothetical protein F5Y06DRAFT_262774 [Hypoxylon sp. FL0890]|nr:hypothetical protein F5Y06DRAFT_262774 [Hypoxylon sp. FL0890]